MILESRVVQEAIACLKRPCTALEDLQGCQRRKWPAFFGAFFSPQCPIAPTVASKPETQTQTCGSALVFKARADFPEALPLL